MPRGLAGSVLVLSLSLVAAPAVAAAKRRDRDRDHDRLPGQMGEAPPHLHEAPLGQA